MPTPADLSLGWKSYEVLQSGDKVPFSKSLARVGAPPNGAVRQMMTLESIGVSEAQRTLKDSKGGSRVVRKDDKIWLLKCKPSCWRLYFYVSETKEEKRIIYVHAVCKKKTAENDTDAQKARVIADGIRPGGSRITPFAFPPR